MLISTLRSRMLNHAALKFATALITVPLAFASGVANGKVSITEQNGTTVTHVTIDDVQTQTVSIEGAAFTSLKLKGVEGHEGIDYQVGRPRIPVVRLFVNSEPKITHAAAKGGAEIESGLKIEPNQPPRVKRPDEKNTLVIDKDFYTRKATKSETYTVAPAGSVNGQKRYLVTLYPIQYDAAANKWSLISSFKIETYSGDKLNEIAEGREVFAFIVGEKFHNNEALRSYAVIKESLGYQIEFINVTSADTPETIRAALKAIYARPETKLKHALIIGDAEDVPGHNSNIITGITDHYYRAIDTDNYDSDINGPDIGVGRVSVSDADQLAVVLAKFTRYTHGQFDSENWLNEVSFIATDDRWQVAEATHNYAIQNYTTPHQYTGIFPQETMAGGDQLYAITHRVSDDKVVEVLRRGRTIINYSGHGSDTFWAGPNVSQADVRSLTDINALPFVISNACITGNFRMPESFGETWQRHQAGAVMFWGSMDNTYWDEDDILEKAMYDGIYRDGYLRFHDITSHALSEHWRHYGGEGKAKYYWETYVTFGDPSIELRTTKTQELNIDGPSVLPIGVGTATFRVTMNGNPVTGVRVALHNPDRSLSYVSTSDSEGNATFNIAIATRDVVTFNVSAYGQNTQINTKNLQIIPADNPYLSISEVQLNGRRSTNLYLNETVTLGAVLSNLGQQPTTGAALEIISIDGPATLLNGETHIPAMAAHATYHLNGDQIRFIVNSDAQAGDAIRLVMKWTTNEGQTADVPLTFKVLKAGITVTAVDFGSENADGGIAPGSSGPVFLTIKNTGNERIANGTITATPGACVDNVRGDIAFTNLDPGATLRLEVPMTVFISGTCRNGDKVGLQVTGSYQSQAMSVGLVSEATFVAGILSTSERISDNLDTAINDNSTATHEMNINIDGIIKEVAVHVKLEHTYTGDLVVSIVHPDGTEIILHNREGGGTNNIDRIYGLDGHQIADLQKLAGKPISGTWKLLVQDNATSDAGILRFVSLKVRGYINN